MFNVVHLNKTDFNNCFLCRIINGFVEKFWVVTFQIAKSKVTETEKERII